MLLLREHLRFFSSVSFSRFASHPSTKLRRGVSRRGDRFSGENIGPERINPMAAKSSGNFVRRRRYAARLGYPLCRTRYRGYLQLMRK